MIAKIIWSQKLLNDREQVFDVEPIIREPLPGLHHRTRAFIKVQDGCDNHCTFCVTTIARGESRSRPIADVISDIQFALDGGTKEIVLTGVHLGSWGQDFEFASSRSCQFDSAGNGCAASSAFIARAVGFGCRLLFIVGRCASLPASSSAASKRM